MSDTFHGAVVDENVHGDFQLPRHSTEADRYAAKDQGPYGKQNYCILIKLCEAPRRNKKTHSVRAI